MGFSGVRDMSSRALTLGFSLIAGCALAAFGCSNSAAGGSGCVTGQNFVCGCGSGAQGVQTCRADNTLGDCNCTQASLLGGSGGGSSPGQSGGPGRGNAGSNGGSNGGTGGMPAMMGGPAGTGGVTPPGTGGMTGGGMAGSSGSGGGGRAPAGTPYSFCTTNADCGSSGTCTTAMRNTGTTGYCSPSCGPLRPCGKAPSGDVTTSCMLTACTLGSCELANCPDGMNCVQTRVLGQTMFNCQYPIR
jgi:hypothetical protein